MYKIDTGNDIGSIEIGDSVYALDLSDDIVERFSEGSEYLAGVMENLNAANLNDFTKAKEFSRDFINGLMIGDPFDSIYEGLGRSTVKMVLLIPKLLDAYKAIATEAGKAIKF